MKNLIDTIRKLNERIWQKGENMNSDIKFWVGILLLIGGQYMNVFPLTLFSSTIFTNTVQLTGVFLAIWHAVLTIYLVIKHKK